MDKQFNVLSLEDSDLDFEIISEQLIKAGYNLNITRAENRSEFEDLISHNNYDIILADYNLPQFDAFEALTLCTEYCPNTPFICVSGSIGEMKAIDLLKKGAVDYVIKDRLERLPFAVKRALEEAKEKKALKIADEELKKKEESFRTLTENIPDIIARFDKDFRHIYINQAIEKATGLPASSFIGKTNEDLMMPAENVAFWNENMHLAFKTGQQQIFEFEFSSPSGIRYFSSMIVPELTNDGNVATILTVTRDISEQKMAEIALKKSEERLKDIMFSTMDWVWEIDENARYTYSSQRDVDLFGFTSDEIIGKTPFDFMVPEEAERLRAIFNELIAEKLPIKDIENWNIGKDGKKICLLTNGVPILDTNGKLLGYRGIDKNITDRKLAELELINAKEKAEESDRLKTAFLSNMSHEIRTPMNSIMGFASLLPEEENKDMMANYAKIIVRSSEQLLHIIDDIVLYSRLQTKLLSYNPTWFYANSLLADVQQSFNLPEFKKGVDLLVKSDENDQVQIFSDYEKLRQVLTNLISNAFKYTEKGAITLGFLKQDHEIKFYVSDTGMGIPEGEAEKIFDRFYRGSNVNAGVIGGNGLGLSIVKELMDLLGGIIWVESEEGKGSCFYFSFHF